MILTDKFGNKYECNFNFDKCNTLILSGGAIKCLYFLGALHRLKDINFKYYAGTSCGSIVSTLLCIGYSPYEIFNQFVKSYKNEITTALNFTMQNIHQMFLGKSISPDITFEELFKINNKELAFVATNITKLKEEIFCRKTHPNTPIMVAIEMSCSLPIIFPIAKYNNDVFVDGVFFDNFPIKLCKVFNDSNNVLAISTKTSHFNKTSLLKFYQNPCKFKIIFIPDPINKYFYVSKEDQFLMFVTGYNYINDNIIKCEKIKRRNSL